MRVPAQLSMHMEIRNAIESRAQRNYRTPGQEMICLLEFALKYMPESLASGNGRVLNSAHADSQKLTAQDFSAHAGAPPRTVAHGKAREKSA